MNKPILLILMILTACQDTGPVPAPSLTPKPTDVVAEANPSAALSATPKATATALEEVCSPENLLNGAKEFASLGPDLRRVASKAIAPLVAKCLAGEPITESDMQQAFRVFLCEPGILALVDAENGRLGTATAEPDVLAASDALMAGICATPTASPTP